jgi:hypothetical protein
MLRCAASLVTAAYAKVRLVPHDFARLACGTFYKAVHMGSFSDFLRAYKLLIHPGKQE